MTSLGTRLLSIAEKIRWAPALLARITMGLIFVQSGWGKFNHLPKVVEYFSSLGIPAPQLQAPFVTGVELVGGVLLFLGLGTRLISFPLIGTMVVAILTARREDLTGVGALFGMSEYLYIVLFFWLIVEGAGPVSLDHRLFKRKG